MTARDDYPLYHHDVDSDMAIVENEIYVEMLDEVDRLRSELERLRAECKAWMNGVADAVEPLGFDRDAACGPSDLLPGLELLQPRVWPGCGWKVSNL